MYKTGISKIYYELQEATKGKTNTKYQMSKKYSNIIVLENSITVTKDNYISLTDMLKAKDGDFFISDWLRNRNTVEYIGIWERIHNPDFNYGEFATIKSQAGLNIC